MVDEQLVMYPEGLELVEESDGDVPQVIHDVFGVSAQAAGE